MDSSRFRVKPDSKVDLADWSTNDDGGYERDAAEAETNELNEKLEMLQEKLYADGRHRVLVVIQATDSGGKDGTIKHVFDGVNPAGVRVAAFKKPTERELSHDYLWRVHKEVPGNGEMVIFNRSHYEDVLVVRVHELVPKQRWKRRYSHINHFEELLVDEGTTIIKLFLHISKEEQRERLQARLDEPHKIWKFNKADLAERDHWDEYQQAFAAMLEQTSTKHAPWYVIPADRKWFRNLAISVLMVDVLESLDLQWPAAEDGLDGIIVS